MTYYGYFNDVILIADSALPIINAGIQAVLLAILCIFLGFLLMQKI